MSNRIITICRTCKKIMFVVVGTDKNRSAETHTSICSTCIGEMYKPNDLYDENTTAQAQ